MVKRLHNYADDDRLTQEECAELMGCAPSTIANRRYAGLLPYAPTRPITIKAGDLKVLAKMLANGHAKDLHRGLRIQAEDCPTYSRLDGMSSLTYASADSVISAVVKQTHKLWTKYRDEGDE